MTGVAPLGAVTTDLIFFKLVLRTKFDQIVNRSGDSFNSSICKLSVLFYDVILIIVQSKLKRKLVRVLNMNCAFSVGLQFGFNCEARF